MLFTKDFISVFGKMVENGYGDGDLQQLTN